MYVGVLQFELLIVGASSLKDKRRVVRSVRDRLSREHRAAVAEVGLLDRMDAAAMGLSVVAGDGQRAHQLLDAALEKLRRLRDAELGEHRRVVHRCEDLAFFACDEAPPLLTEDEQRAWADLSPEALAEEGEGAP